MSSMQIFGALLAFAACGLVGIAVLERRPGGVAGFALLAVAFAVSGFRRLIYEEGKLVSQLVLDGIVCSAAVVAVGCIVLDRFHRTNLERVAHASGGLPRWPFIVPILILLMSPTTWAWDGERVDRLNVYQSLEALEAGINPNASNAQVAMELEALIERWQVAARKFPGTAVYADHKIGQFQRRLESLR